MKKLFASIGRIALFLALSLTVSYVSVAYSAEILVVANPNSNLVSLSRNEVRQIFMGGTLSRKYDAVTLPVGDTTRIQFNTKVIGLTESRIQSYWAQLLFTGRSKPPKEFGRISDVLDYVSNVDNAVGYVPADVQLPDDLIIIYQR